MKVYHVPRDLSKPLEQQKRELRSQYKNFNYFASDGQKYTSWQRRKHMASIEFIQKRIEGKEKELATLQKKLDRILKAQESNWEKNPYWYSEIDLRVTQKDIEIAEAALQGYKDQLAAETEKANSRNIPIILEFLDQWKARVFAYYQEATDRYNEEIVEYLRRNSEYCDWVNNGDSRQL